MVNCKFTISGGRSGQSLSHTSEDDLSIVPPKIESYLERYKCKICNKNNGSQSDLDKHLRCHTGEKPHKCPECGRGFADISNMYKHVRSQHQFQRMSEFFRSVYFLLLQLLRLLFRHKPVILLMMIYQHILSVFVLPP